ncbi:MAG: hypothetical protein ABEJ22_03985 [Haloferacaceae archaeon]
MTQSGLRDVVEDARVNAVLGWLLVAFLVATAVSTLFDGEVLWAGFTLFLAAVSLVPVVAYRHVRSMLPWEILALAAMPVIARAFLPGVTVGTVTLTGRVTTYLSVAAVALIVAVELDLFTPVKMNHAFAVFFVAVATMATAGVWAVIQWLSDEFLGTAFLLNGRPERLVERALMWDFVAATVVGVLAGLVFEYYFRRIASGEERLPTEIEEVL